MKNQILRISILPLIIITVLSFTELQPQKDNENGNRKQGQNDRNDRGNNGKDKSQGKANSAREQGNNNSQDDERRKKNDRGQSRDKGNEHADRGQGNNGNGKSKENNKFKGKKITVHIGGWEYGDIDWGINNPDHRKYRRDRKKITICHHTSEGGYPVNISVSENAVNAHMNHGDEIGSCSGNYPDIWARDYIRSRENVYNTYQQTWETMSYGEALVRLAADKLLGIRSDLDIRRSTYSPEEVQRREVLILDLQNNVNSLEAQLSRTRQRTDGLNIVIQL